MSRITFGWYSSKIKSYTADELKLDNTHPPYQVRQRIFHIMYIPLVPVGKVYVFKKDKSFYNAPLDVVQQIKARRDYRTPWYAFVIPILLVAGIILFRSYENYITYRNHKEADAMYAITMKEDLIKLDHLEETNYLEIVTVGPGYNPFYILKVHNVRGNQVQFLKSKEQTDYSNTIDIVSYFHNNADSLGQISISIDKLKKMIPKEEYDLSFGNKRDLTFVGENIFNDGKKYRIRKIEDYNIPSFTLSSLVSSQEEISGFEMKNEGEPVKFIDMKLIEGDLQTETNQLQELIPYDNYLMVDLKTIDLT